MEDITSRKKIFHLKLILLLASAVITFALPAISNEKSEKNRDVHGQLTMLTNGNCTCSVTGEGEECMVSDCRAPGISTECFENEDDHQTTINDKMENF